MYISQINCKTQGLRKAFINSMTNDRHYNIKSLKKLDKDLARTYTNTKYYGGSLKSFFKKIGRFAKKVLNAPAQIASKIYPWMKKGIDALDKNETAKTLISKIPIVGPALPAVVHGLKDITDNVDVLIKDIQEKNPGASFQQIKEIVRKVIGTFNDVKDKVPEEDRKIIKDQVDKVLKHLPEIIKKEGVAKVDKAAGYLPYLDRSSMKTEERSGKGGRVLPPKIRFMKPPIINKYKEVFSKLPAYDAKAVGEVGGALFNKSWKPTKPKRKLTEEEKKQQQERIDKSLAAENRFARKEREKSKFKNIDEMKEWYNSLSSEEKAKIDKEANKHGLGKKSGRTILSGEVTTPAAKVGCGRVAMAGEKSGRTRLAGDSSSDSERAKIIARLRGKK